MAARDWQRELDDYIVKVLGLGFSREIIERTLRDGGWKQQDIDSGMRRIARRAQRGSSAALPLLLPAGSLRKVSLLSEGSRKAETLYLPSASSSVRLRIYMGRVWENWVVAIEHFFNGAEWLFAVAYRMVAIPFALVGIMSGLMRNGKHAAAHDDVSRSEGSLHTNVPSQRFRERILIRDIIRLAARMFRARRLRTFLTILGMSVGIGTILFLVSFGYGIQNILFERITTADALLTLDAFAPSDDALIVVDDELVAAIGSIPHVAATSVLALTSGEVSLNGFSAAGSMFAVDERYLQLSGARLLAGTVLAGSDPGQIVLSSAAAKLLNVETAQQAVGKDVRIVISLIKDKATGESVSYQPDYALKVAGVLEDPFSVFAYIPLSVVQGRTPLFYAQLKVKVDDSSFLDSVRERILAEGLLVSALSETVAQAKKIFNVITVILGLFGIITLFVSAIGMLNTMTIALLERTQEVGIMKAVGASNFDVWKLFLAEAMIMGFLGGIGGIAIGFFTSSLFNYGVNALAQAFGGQSLDLFQSPVWFVLTIIVFSAVVGMVTGLWPARRASRLDPLEALKYK